MIVDVHLFLQKTILVNIPHRWEDTPIIPLTFWSLLDRCLLIYRIQIFLQGIGEFLNIFYIYKKEKSYANCKYLFQCKTFHNNKN